VASFVWNVDPAHSAVNLIARHMVVARVFGRFNEFRGRLRMDPADLSTGSVDVRIAARSIDTNNPDRDAHLRSVDFFDVDHYPELVFQSTRVELTRAASFRVVGELTIRDVTRPWALEARSLGFLEGPNGADRAIFQARGVICRSDYGMTWNRALETGGLLLGEKIDIELDVEAVALDRWTLTRGASRAAPGRGPAAPDPSTSARWT